jgi:FkbM family methyltransferase
MSLWKPLLQSLPSARHAQLHLAARLPGVFGGALPGLAIVGAADEGRRLIELCRRHEIKIHALADDSPQRRGTKIDGIEVTSFDTLLSLDRSVPVVVASHRLLGAVRRLRAAGFHSACAFAALQIVDPARFPPHMFYDGWFEDMFESRKRYLDLFERLADDRSRAVLDAILGFRLTLDPEALAPVLDHALYGAGDLPPPPDPSVYVDAGAFDGDTIKLYLDRYGGKCKTVHGFEPDPETYLRLKSNFSDDPRVVPHNVGLSKTASTLHFKADASRASILDSGGGIQVKVVGLDEVLKGGPAGVIKMNIEGAEIDALYGAANTLRKYRPTLMLSVYHRPADLWRIPEVVDEIAPGYRFYFRQHDGGTIESVLYAVPA